MNTFFLKNWDRPEKVCYEIYGIDKVSGIRYSVALLGTRKAAERTLDDYLWWKLPSWQLLKDERPDYSEYLHIEKTTIAAYKKNRYNELMARVGLHSGYGSACCFVNEFWDFIFDRIVESALLSGVHEFDIGGELEQEAFNCTRFRVKTGECAGNPSEIEVTLELVFRNLPDSIAGKVFDQSAVVFRGTAEQLKTRIGEYSFEDCCRSIFMEGYRNFFYGYPPVSDWMMTPIFEDSRRERHDLMEEFYGVIPLPDAARPPLRRHPKWSY